MQLYNEQTAALYKDIWGGYGRAFGNAAVDYLIGIGKEPGFAIDLACGTGDLAEVLCERGYSVLGLDCSPAMLVHAGQRCSRFQQQGTVKFQLANITAFESHGQPASLVTCSYDSINHLDSADEWRACFESVRKALSSDGYFVFDMNTMRGLEDWNRIKITERDTYTVISRGFFNPGTGMAWKKFSGFRRTDSGLFERFEQIISNTALPVDTVVALLGSVGLIVQHAALLQDLRKPIADEESHDRIVLVVRPAPE